MKISKKVLNERKYYRRLAFRIQLKFEKNLMLKNHIFSSEILEY